jgi:hypothetical protein
MTELTAKGAAVYVNAAELVALHDAYGLLSMLLESAGQPGPELGAAINAVASVLDKAAKVGRRDRAPSGLTPAVTVTR